MRQEIQGQQNKKRLQRKGYGSPVFGNGTQSTGQHHGNQKGGPGFLLDPSQHFLTSANGFGHRF